MPYAGLYLAERFLFRIVDFFHHWYLDASRAFLHRFINVLENIDYTFAVHITLRHFFEPLYGDYSIIGRIVGFVFRSLRVLIGGVIYAILGAAFFVFYIAWFLVPLLILFLVLRHFSGGRESFFPY